MIDINPILLCLNKVTLLLMYFILFIIPKAKKLQLPSKDKLKGLKYFNMVTRCQKWKFFKYVVLKIYIS